MMTRRYAFLIALSALLTLNGLRSAAAEPPKPDQSFTENAGDVGLEMVWIEGGSFLMGSYEEEGARAEDELVHLAAVDSFWIAATEVTNAQFSVFAKATGYKTEAETVGFGYIFLPGSGDDYFWKWTPGANWRHPLGPGSDLAGRDKYPVEMMSWNDAKAFCSWLSGKTGGEYRLPREAEWEYAARAGTQTSFIWGPNEEGAEGWLNATDLTPSPTGTRWKFHFDMTDGYWYASPVGSFRPNRWGLYDMFGNILEWCEDWYGGKYFDGQPAKNPVGPAMGDDYNSRMDGKDWSGPTRVLRGANWAAGPRFCRSAARMCLPANFLVSHNGFRPVRIPQSK